MTEIRIFSNGSQYADWSESNCSRCVKGAVNCLRDDEWPTCPIEGALLEGYCGNGTVSEEMARRAGYDGNLCGRYVWPCSEVEWTEEWKAGVRAKDDNHALTGNEVTAAALAPFAQEPGAEGEA
jgi:hypothetical protein